MFLWYSITKKSKGEKSPQSVTFLWYLTPWKKNHINTVSSILTEFVCGKNKTSRLLYVFCIYIFTSLFYREGNWKTVPKSVLWLITWKYCTLYAPPDTKDDHSHIRRHSPQGLSSLFEYNTLFLDLETINILTSYIDHPSLKILQYHFMASEDFRTEGSVSLWFKIKYLWKWQV